MIAMFCWAQYNQNSHFVRDTKIPGYSLCLAFHVCYTICAHPASCLRIQISSIHKNLYILNVTEVSNSISLPLAYRAKGQVRLRSKWHQPEWP